MPLQDRLIGSGDLEDLDLAEEQEILESLWGPRLDPFGRRRSVSPSCFTKLLRLINIPIGHTAKLIIDPSSGT